MTAFTAPRGTFDLLPPRSEAVLAVRAGLAAPLSRAGYGYVETPTFEATELFARGVGESTDVVSKEMYSFTTRGGDAVTLRPEGTAGVVRAAVEHGLARGALPVKLWYSGSFYRYERPQAGRYRHFSQVGAEVLGATDPAADAELVVLGMDGYRGLGLDDVRLVLNSLGDAACRPAYRERLVAFLRGLPLDEETRRRVELNPLRVLDDKRPQLREWLADAPLVTDFLCDECRAHHDAVRTLLADAGLTWEDDPRLVRGLDYYTRTTFTYVGAGLGAQSEIGGGGRYDGLAEAVGGPPLPGVGWALGVERTLLALEHAGVEPAPPPAPAVFGVPIGPAATRRVFALVTELRRAGVGADLAAGGRGLKGMMRMADRSGARLALLVGERDLQAGTAELRDLASGEQRTVPLDRAVAEVRAALA